MFVANAAENLPDQTMKPAGNHGDGLCVSVARDETAIDGRENRAFGLYRRVASLIEDNRGSGFSWKASLSTESDERF